MSELAVPSLKIIAALTTLVVVLSSAVSLADEQPQVPEDLAQVLSYDVGEWSVGRLGGRSGREGSGARRAGRGWRALARLNGRSESLDASWFSGLQSSWFTASGGGGSARASWSCPRPKTTS